MAKDTASQTFQIDRIAVGDEPTRLSTFIFGFILVLPIFATLVFGAVDNTTWIVIAVVWALMVMLWLADSWKAGGLLISGEFLQVPLIGLFLVGLAQIVPFGSTTLPEVGLQVPRTISMDPYATRFFTSKVLVFASFFGLCLVYMNSESRLRIVVRTLIIFGAVLAFFGILQRLANPESIYGIREIPQAIPFGPFVNQHHFAGLMEMTAGVTLGGLFGSNTGRDRKVLLALAYVIMGAATVLTSSRGGLLSFICVTAVVAGLSFTSGRAAASGQKSPSSRLALVFGAAALIFVILGVVVFVGGNDSLLRGIGAVQAAPDVTTGRIHFWPIAISIFLQHPLLGAGLDAFGVAFTRFDTWSGLFRVEQAHNEYLQMLADAGIVGFAFLASFIFLLFRGSMKALRDHVGPARDVMIGALAGVFGILVHSFFDFPLRTWSNSFFFLLLCSIAVSRIHAHRSII